MRALLVVFLAIFCIQTAWGTAQISDRLIYNGKEYAMFTNPMEVYFEKHPDKRPQSDVISTANWRGYVATFEIRGKYMYVKNIDITIYNEEEDSYIRKNVLNEIFPEQQEVKVDWMTGLLVLPYGEIINYVHMGYASTYEHYIILEIKEGKLKKEKKLDYEQYVEFKEKQFQAFKKTEEYKKQKKELKGDDFDDEFIDSFLREFVIDYSSKILD